MIRLSDFLAIGSLSLVLLPVISPVWIGSVVRAYHKLVTSTVVKVLCWSETLLLLSISQFLMCTQYPNNSMMEWMRGRTLTHIRSCFLVQAATQSFHHYCYQITYCMEAALLLFVRLCYKLILKTHDFMECLSRSRTLSLALLSMLQIVCLVMNMTESFVRFHLQIDLFPTDSSIATKRVVQSHRKHTLLIARQIPTIAKTKQREKRRTRRQNRFDQLVLRLKMLEFPGFPAGDRQKIMKNCIKYTVNQRWRKGKKTNLRYRALNWIIAEILRMFSVETNGVILYWFSRVLCEIGYNRDTVHTLATEIIRDRNIQSIRARCIILSMIDKMRVTRDLLKPCCEMIENFHARGGKLTEFPLENSIEYEQKKLWQDCEIDRAIEVLYFIAINDAQIYSEIVQNDAVMLTAFRAAMIVSAVEECENWQTVPYSFVGCMLRELTVPDQLHVVARYTDNLVALLLVGTPWMVASILESAEFVRLAIAHDAIFDRIWQRFVADNKAFKRGSSLSRWNFLSPMLVLKFALTQNNSMVEKYLGLGLLESAAYFAHAGWYGDSQVADTYRRVLAVAPEWKRRFRELTANGKLGTDAHHYNVTRLGQSIPERRPRPKRWYVFENDSEDEEY